MRGTGLLGWLGGAGQPALATPSGFFLAEPSSH